MHNGENEQALKKIIDLMRMIAISVLLLNIYYYCYEAFVLWGITSKMTDHLLQNIMRTGLLDGFQKSKLIGAILLLISTLGVKGKKSESVNYKMIFVYFLIGIILYFSSAYIFKFNLDIELCAIAYITVTITGFILIMTSATLLARIIQQSLHPAVFNTHNETFPQEERLLTNEFSVNLPARYHLKGKMRKSWVNFVNPMRGLLVIGSPGSGKSYFVIEHVIRQHIEKGFSMFIYDYKYDDLTRLAYNHFLKNIKHYTVLPEFYVINFDDLNHSNRCNPLDPSNMHDITDAVEAARVIMLGLNRSWLKKQGDFFVESPINFLTALIWFLRNFENGCYCTLPHVIELMQVEVDKLFTILRTEPEIEAYINPFISAFQSGSLEQLEGQLDAAKISLARLSSPALYYVLSGNDFTLDINNPNSPKILSLANNPQKQDVYGPVLSLYITRMTKIINQKNMLKTSLVIDEFTTVTFLGFDTLIATGRSNKISTTLAIQDASQLKLNYGKELADVIINICGNIIVGQANGEIAKQVSERLGKTLQQRESISINSNDTSISRSKQLDYAVPLSTVSSLSAGEFVGMVSDNPDQIIALKTFHSMIINDHDSLKKEKANYCRLPVLRKIEERNVSANFYGIKEEIKHMVETLMNDILNDPEKEYMIVKKR